MARTPKTSSLRDPPPPPTPASSDTDEDEVKPVQRLQGALPVQNQVTHVFRDAITNAFKAAVEPAAEAPASDAGGEDVQVVAVGQKRAASPSLMDRGAPPAKKPYKKPSTALPVLQLDLAFSPPNDHAFFAAALASAPPAVQHPTPFTDVVFQHARENTKTPHRLYLRHPVSNAALVELDPIDPACAAVSSWIAWIAPPPLTKSGKPFKRRSAARKAPQREPLAVVPSGAGGLVDALALLSQIHETGVRMNSRLSAELVPASSSHTGEPAVVFHLLLDVSLKPALFYPAPYSRAKRILVDYLIPSTAPLSHAAKAKPGVPREAGIDYFYACLGRARRTVNGKSIAPAEEREPVRESDQPPETDEERAARLRREAKGKQRAITPEPEPEAANGHGAPADDGPEDEMLYPAGLAVELMPFQARSVRWMLAREGKRVVPRRPVKEVQLSQASEAKGKAKMKRKGKGKGREVDESVGSGEAHDVIMGGGDEDLDGDVVQDTSMDHVDATPTFDADEEVDEKTPPVLEDLDAETLRDMKRGPLWAKVQLPVLARPDAADAVDHAPREHDLWLNRTSMLFSEDDPLEYMIATSGTATPALKTERGEDGVDGEEETRASKKVVGGIEGHGLLAEEVGLGKTVEALSLILTHRDKQRRKLPAYFNPITDSEVQPCGITLIIAPTAIVGQWQSEIARLAPSIRVLRYEGVKQLKAKEDAEYIAKRFDVVLTTFDVLRKEVAFARKPAQRGLRNKREIRYRRSMLVELDFLRVLMDEAQMVGDSAGATAETASLIARRFSWAVTSTPLRDRITDLKSLLTFLRVEPIASGKTSLQRLLDETPSFKRLWNEIGERTLKSQVQHELFLPKQIRYIVPVEFTAVERFYYDQCYNEALQTLGLSAEGTPLNQGVDPETGAPNVWVPDKPEMLRALTTLRQLCTHPQIGGHNREALGRVLKTVDEVYAAMRSQAVSDIQSDQRAMLAARVRRAQYAMWDEDVENRFEPSLKLFESAVDEVDPIIGEVTQEIHDEWKARKKAASRASSNDPSDDGLAGALELGFRSAEGADETEIMSEKERAASQRIGVLRNRLRDLLFVKHSALFFSGHANYNMKRQEEETAAYAKAEALRQTILQPYEKAVERAQVTLKQQLDTRDSTHELDVGDFEIQFNKSGHGLRAIRAFEDIATTSDILNGYAELIYQYRQSIIQMLLTRVSIAGDDATGEEYEERAALQEKLLVYLEAYTVLVGEWSYGITGTRSALGDQLKAEAEGYLYAQEILPPQGVPPPGGIERDVPIHDLEQAMQEAMNAIAGPSGKKAANGHGDVVMDEGEDDDEEDDDRAYEDGSKGKGKAKAKRKQKAPGEKTRHQAKRTANMKLNSYKEFLAPTVESGHSPADVLRYELLVERLESKGEDKEFTEIVPLRHLIKQLREAAERSESNKEIAILDRERTRLNKMLASLEKVGDRIRSELSDFGKASNVRITYFANLQQISDDVADPDFGHKKWRGLLIEMEDLRQAELDLKASIESKQSRRRYLEHLDSAEEREEEETTCPICAEHFSKGVLTTCGHLTCASCFRKWHGHSRSCALCKQALPQGSYQTVSYGPKQISPDADAAAQQPEEYLDSHGVPHGFDVEPPKLSEIDSFSMEKIREVETAAPLSSKADFITKHVKFLRRRDSEAKIVIFSAWQEALALLMESFNRNGIKFVRLEGATGKGKKETVVKRFQEDPDIAAFFLHTRSQSAGLNLTIARYVFLVEPLLHPSLELQAVARVHRITQTKQTTVFQFAVSDTVDRGVADLRARQGTSLFLADADVDVEQESRLVQQKDRAVTDLKKVDDITEDEDELARCILSGEAFLNLQRHLLPHRLQAQRGVAIQDGGAAGPVVHTENPLVEPMAMAGIAAAGRAATAPDRENMGLMTSGSGAL